MTDTAPGRRWTDYVPLDELVDADRNPKGHDGPLIGASFRRFGFVELPTVDERTGKLVAGHGRKAELIALRDAGDDPPEYVTVTDDGTWLVPLSRGWASKDDDDAAAYVVTSNRSTEAGGWLPDLGPYLDELAATPAGLDGVGFDREDVDRMLSNAGLLGEQRGGFLDDLAGDGRHEPMAATTYGADGMVAFQVPMTEADRDELVRRLRAAAETHGTDTLAATLLAVVPAP